VVVDYINTISSGCMEKNMKQWIFNSPLVINAEDNVTREQIIAQLIEQKIIKGEADYFTLELIDEAPVVEETAAAEPAENADIVEAEN